MPKALPTALFDNPSNFNFIIAALSNKFFISFDLQIYLIIYSELCKKSGPFFNYKIVIFWSTFSLSKTTPHLHLVFVPVVHTKDKNGNDIEKIACSEYWKGKDSYRELQNNFHKYITTHGFDLQRGNTKENTHIPIETLKQITNYENIKYELNNNQIQPLETKNTSLILQQNQALIKYTNKLKTQLNKSYTAIGKFEELQKQNINLKQENEKLKQENNKLKNYIEKSFQVVRNLFSFPIDRFKRLVDNFVLHFDR